MFLRGREAVELIDVVDRCFGRYFDVSAIVDLFFFFFFFSKKNLLLLCV